MSVKFSRCVFVVCDLCSKLSHDGAVMSWNLIPLIAVLA